MKNNFLIRNDFKIDGNGNGYEKLKDNIVRIRSKSLQPETTVLKNSIIYL